MTQYMSLNDIYKELQQKPEYMDLERGATSDEIRNIEQILGVKLPDQYVDFLQIFGFMMADGLCINGVCPPELNDYVSVIEFTKDRRSEVFYENGIQPCGDNAVVIHDNGESYVLLFCEGHPQAGKIVWRHLAERYQDSESFDNFNEFLTFWIN